MKANELRIGNWIKEPIESGGKIGQVKRIETDKDGYSHYLDHCSPIPLTEEWLLKFGSKKVIPNYTEWSVPEYTKDGKSICVEFDKDGCFFTGGESLRFSQNIKYVHQLQNIYFALTGEELTV